MAAYEEAGETDEWYTPRYIFEAIGETFDLDVACPPEGPRHVPALAWYHTDALKLPWRGFVWRNPPFGHPRQDVEMIGHHGVGDDLDPAERRLFPQHRRQPFLRRVRYKPLAANDPGDEVHDDHPSRRT